MTTHIIIASIGIEVIKLDNNIKIINTDGDDVLVIVEKQIEDRTYKHISTSILGGYDERDKVLTSDGMYRITLAEEGGVVGKAVYVRHFPKGKKRLVDMMKKEICCSCKSNCSCNKNHDNNQCIKTQELFVLTDYILNNQTSLYYKDVQVEGIGGGEYEITQDANAEILPEYAVAFSAQTSFQFFSPLVQSLLVNPSITLDNSINKKAYRIQLAIKYLILYYTDYHSIEENEHSELTVQERRRALDIFYNKKEMFKCICSLCINTSVVEGFVIQYLEEQVLPDCPECPECPDCPDCPDCPEPSVNMPPNRATNIFIKNSDSRVTQFPIPASLLLSDYQDPENDAPLYIRFVLVLNVDVGVVQQGGAKLFFNGTDITTGDVIPFASITETNLFVDYIGDYKGAMYIVYTVADVGSGAFGATGTIHITELT